MYTNTLHLQIAGAEKAITEPVERYGVQVYVDSDPDIVGCDFKIDPADSKGISLFREFASRMAEHYKTLNK
jgi:hypothetical protein